MENEHTGRPERQAVAATASDPIDSDELERAVLVLAHHSALAAPESRRIRPTTASMPDARSSAVASARTMSCGLRSAMGDLCESMSLAHCTPHRLRHRRISLWHFHGVPARELADRAGHAKPSISLDVYSHVIVPDEVDPGALKAIVLRGSTASTVVAVMHR